LIKVIANGVHLRYETADELALFSPFKPKKLKIEKISKVINLPENLRALEQWRKA